MTRYPNYSHDAVKTDSDGRVYRACMLCGIEIPMSTKADFDFCSQSHRRIWQAEEKLRALKQEN